LEKGKGGCGVKRPVKSKAGWRLRYPRECATNEALGKKKSERKSKDSGGSGLTPLLEGKAKNRATKDPYDES